MNNKFQNSHAVGKKSKALEIKVQNRVATNNRSSNKEILPRLIDDLERDSMDELVEMEGDQSISYDGRKMQQSFDQLMGYPGYSN